MTLHSRARLAFVCLMAADGQSRVVSPGVVRDTIKKLACLPGGWLQ